MTVFHKNFSPLTPCRLDRFGRRRDGFTLIELLTVIAIIAVLAGIIIPTVGRARSSAYDVQCKSNLRQLHMAVMLYVQDNRDSFPLSSNPSESTSWTRELLDGGYVPRVRIVNGDSRSEIFGCPSQRKAVPGTTLLRTYGYNYYIGDGPRGGRKYGTVAAPTRTLLFADGNRNSSATDPLNAYNVQLIPGSIMPTPAHPDAKGKINCLFVDGHVEGRRIGDTADGIPEGPGGKGSALAELRYQFWQGF